MHSRSRISSPRRGTIHRARLLFPFPSSLLCASSDQRSRSINKVAQTILAVLFAWSPNLNAHSPSPCAQRRATRRLRRPLSLRRICSNLVQVDLSVVQFSVDPPLNSMDRSCSAVILSEAKNPGPALTIDSHAIRDGANFQRMSPLLQLVQQELRFHFIGRTDRQKHRAKSCSYRWPPIG